MRRKLYISIFLALATIFIPVVINFGVASFVVPAAWIALGAAKALLHAEWAQSLWGLALFSLYLLAFYAIARLTYWLSMLSVAQASRVTIQSFVLLAIIASSFVRAITYDSIQGRGGTYTFWGAASRYFDKHHSQ